VEAIEASRRRLLLAEDDERRRLAERLERGAGAALGELDGLVREARRGAGDTLASALDRAADQVARTRPELDSLVRGLGGVGPEGLRPALERLAAGVPLAVELDLADVVLAREAASALWFACAESLANAVKHSGARSVKVALVARDGTVRLSVADDGRGGADVRGSGLVGLADRLAALGGRLEVESPPSGGTNVVAELKLL
jgi:signal transduction histidine kinase